MIGDFGTGAGLTITIDDVAVETYLERIGKLMTSDDAHHLLDGVGAIIESQTKDRFETTKTDPAGNVWAPWADSTVKQYERDGNSHYSLLMHGGRGSQHLHTSITHAVHDMDGEVEVGTNVEYAAVHNYGANFSIVSNHAEILIPQRQFLGLSVGDRREVDEYVKRFMEALV